MTHSAVLNEVTALHQVEGLIKGLFKLVALEGFIAETHAVVDLLDVVDSGLEGFVLDFVVDFAEVFFLEVWEDGDVVLDELLLGHFVFFGDLGGAGV